jgi:hypothetical protein
MSRFDNSRLRESVCVTDILREWRKIHNKQLYDLYLSRSVIRVIKSRKMRRVGYVTHMGKRRGAYGVVKPAGKRKLGKPKRMREAVD